MSLELYEQVMERRGREETYEKRLYEAIEEKGIKAGIKWYVNHMLDWIENMEETLKEAQLHDYRNFKRNKDY